ncbi:alanine/ornithine racemase family PLP-dependent enzyme [Leptolyngbya sp. BC1307]|uniref:alanine/ornithine racemase family PLP-dependent enzyme n=1 Tax=Leptolyngbya sp. BC1307 TaxID=2029589 RepID=UPI000EFBC1A2|nr:alanine/ornithine racemase family PLP-dependent enzyme [Leptolyngbya sp. BC1307]
MKLFLPRIEISLSQIQANAQVLCDLYSRKGISLMGVSKAVLGEPAIAEAMIRGGVRFIADSRIENIQRMKKAGISARLVLLRTALSQAESVIESADISLNTEIETLQRLSYYAEAYRKIHRVIIMVELGDLREGVMPCDLVQFIRTALLIPYIKIIGIGCNLACYGGIKPSSKNMRMLSDLTEIVENEFNITLEVVSGGNSANYEWYNSDHTNGKINNLRIGESILLGCETVNRQPIPGLHTHAFQLVAEVIESKQKPSLPFGERCQDAFGTVPNQAPEIQDRGIRQRAIIALGRQDILTSGLKSNDRLKILGSSSDHTILDSQNHSFQIGDEVSFSLDYGGLLSAMTSPFISKQFVDPQRHTVMVPSPAMFRLPAKA